MNGKNEYAGLHFGRTRPRIPRRLLLTFAAPIFLVVVWNLVPPDQLIFPLFLFLVALSWIATYGWSEAYAKFISYLQRHQSH